MQKPTHMIETFSARVYEPQGQDCRESDTLVKGFAGKPEDLHKAATRLATLGHRVLVYTHNPRIILDGDPGALPRLITDVIDHFMENTADDLPRRYGGVSLGGAIASGMQKADPEAKPGLYAATGIDLAELVKRRYLFRAMARIVHRASLSEAFANYSLEDLRAEWKEIQIPPSTPFAIALGTRDLIIRPGRIEPTLARWQKDNPDIEVKWLPGRGHNATLKWYDDSIDTMLALAEKIPTPEPLAAVAPLPLGSLAADSQTI
ncbi:MAG TPA: hypothetical protein VHD60_02190 [Candidatus Saccharimonadales bacterium]|nr:hypothetical protein [Candidatus Saccharimonadales bacterium]